MATSNAQHGCRLESPEVAKTEARSHSSIASMGLCHNASVDGLDRPRFQTSRPLSTSYQGLSSAPGFLVIGTKKTGNTACCSILAPCFRNR